MRIITLLSLCFLTYAQGSAQEDSVHQKRRIELGLNITSVLANFFNSDFPRAMLEQYIIAGKVFHQNRHAAFRFHIGGSVDSEKTVNLASIKSRELLTKIGCEWHRPIGQKIILLYGADAIFTYSHTTTDAFRQSTLTESSTLQGGPAAFLGFRYQLNKWLSLTTESSLSVIWRRRDRFVTENANRNQFVKERSFNLGHTLPVSLYVYFKL